MINTIILIFSQIDTEYCNCTPYLSKVNYFSKNIVNNFNLNVAIVTPLCLITYASLIYEVASEGYNFINQSKIKVSNLNWVTTTRIHYLELKPNLWLKLSKILL